MRKITLLIISFIFLWCFSLQAQGKTRAVLNDWTQTASNTAVASNEIDVGGAFALKLFIQHALTTHGTEQALGYFIIESASEFGTSDEDWGELYRIPMVTGTPDTVLLGTEAAGQTVLEIASTTGRYTNDGTQWMFILDNTLASSEMIKVISAVTDVSVTILDGTTNAHTNADFISDIAHSGAYFVDVYSEDRIRVTVDNTHDAGGPQVTWRISYITTDSN